MEVENTVESKRWWGCLHRMLVGFACFVGGVGLLLADHDEDDDEEFGDRFFDEAFFLEEGFPTIVEHPVGQVVTPGTTVTLSVVAEGNPPLFYQWNRNGLVIDGAESSELVLESVQPRDAGVYTVTVFNDIWAVESFPADVVVSIFPAQFADRFEDRSVIGGPAGSIAGSNVGATREFDEPRHGGKAGGKTVWISWIAPNDGIATFDTSGSNFDTLLSIYEPEVEELDDILEGDDDEGDEEGDDDDDENEESFADLDGEPEGQDIDSPPDSELENALASLSAELSGSALRRRNSHPVPVDDDPEAEEGDPLDHGDDDDEGDEEEDSDDDDDEEEDEDDEFEDPLLGIGFQPVVDGVPVEPLPVDLLLAIDNLEEVGRDDDSEAFHASLIQFWAQKGRRYEIAVDGFAGASGQVVLNWSLLTANKRLPVILTTPNDRSLNFGDPLSLSVDFQSTELVDLQWFRNGLLIEGANDATLEIGSFQPVDTGIYRLLIQLDEFRVFSRPIELQINSEGQSDVIARDKLPDALESALKQSQAVAAALVPQQLQRRAELSRGFTGSQVFNTILGSKDANEPLHCGLVGGSSYWFAYEAPAGGLLRINTNGSEFDTILAAYRVENPNTGFAGLAPVACDNNSGADGMDSQVQFQVAQNTLYAVVIDGVQGAAGLVQLNYELATAAVTSVVSTRGPSLSIQWIEPEGLVLSWPVNAGSFEVLTKPAMDNGSWAVLTNPVATVGSDYRVRVSTTPTSSFYRLRAKPRPASEGTVSR